MDSWRIEFQNSGDSSSNSTEFFRFILLVWRVFYGDSKLAQGVCDFWAWGLQFIENSNDICTLFQLSKFGKMMQAWCMGAHRPMKWLFESPKWSSDALEMDWIARQLSIVIWSLIHAKWYQPV
jgi:hypothetical protein